MIKLRYVTFEIPYEKVCPLKPHYHAIKIQKNIHIQLSCHYLFGITTNVQLSP
jgi:hypothetical protein